METCERCGKEAPASELDGYLECRRCVENRESSHEDNCNADSGPLSLDEQCAAALKLKEGRS